MEFYFERLDNGNTVRVRLPEEGTVSIGRSPKNAIALSANERCVSGIHAVIYSTPQRLLLQDMQSTNGTFVNGRQVQECVLEAGDEVRLGRGGPRFRVIGGGEPLINTGLAANVCNGGNDAEADTDDLDDVHDDHDDGGDNDYDSSDYDDDDSAYRQTTTPASADNGRGNIRAVIMIVFIAAVIIAGLLTAFAFRGCGGAKDARPESADKQKTPVAKSKPSSEFFTGRESGTHADTDIDESADDESGSASSSSYSLQPLSTSASLQTIDRINDVLARFGETDYRAPPEMVERVEYYIALNTGRRKRYVEATLRRGRQFFPMIHRVFSEKNIPLELAYVSMQESGFDTKAVSHAGAVGLWQFMPATARRYGLEVSARADERTDPEKSTYAAAAYFRHLIAIFGAKSSVMLSMAAYNAGEQRIINALKRIDDPMRNRDFWYLYRMGWLAEETNEYIPQIIALIIISENLEEYGFNE